MRSNKTDSMIFREAPERHDASVRARADISPTIESRVLLGPKQVHVKSDRTAGKALI